MLLGIPYHNWLESFKVIVTVIVAVFSLAFFLAALAEFCIYRSRRR